MKSAKYWIVLSVVLSVIGLAALGIWGLNTGIDFTGGNVYDIQFEQKVTQADIEQAVTTVVGNNYQVQASQPKGEAAAAGSGFFVRTQELDGAKRADLMKGLEALGKYTVASEENVSGAVSKELTQKAALALAVAAALQLIYIWLRFDYKFGITAVVAILHDAIITLGMMAIFRVQVNSAFVAAIMTVLGYSMNDTVVVIDRIRENLAQRKKGEALAAMVTRSIQEVITRSLTTGVSVQVMLIAMLVFGGDTIWDFSMTLLIGVTSGTYSSIFIASALWLFWTEATEARKKTAGKGRPVKA
jgi:preprotein translocase subunit SecF